MTDTLGTTFQQIDYQDAYDQVARYTHTERAAIESLRKALAAGDEVRARAIVAYSKKEGWDVSLSFARVAETTQAALYDLIDDYNIATLPIRNAVIGKDYTAEGGRKKLAALVPKWTARVDDIETKARVMIDAANKARDAAMVRFTHPKGSVQEQLVTEMKVTRAWDRLKAELNAGTTAVGDRVAAFSAKLAATTDPYELEALVSEGPSYLTIGGIRDAGQLITSMLAQRDPGVANATAKAHEAARFEAVLVYAINVVRKIVTSESISTTELKRAGWVDMTSIDYTR